MCLSVNRRCQTSGWRDTKDPSSCSFPFVVDVSWTTPAELSVPNAKRTATTLFSDPTLSPAFVLSWGRLLWTSQGLWTAPEVHNLQLLLCTYKCVCRRVRWEDQYQSGLSIGRYIQQLISLAWHKAFKRWEAAVIHLFFFWNIVPEKLNVNRDVLQVWNHFF